MLCQLFRIIVVCSLLGPMTSVAKYSWPDSGALYEFYHWEYNLYLIRKLLINLMLIVLLLHQWICLVWEHKGSPVLLRVVRVFIIIIHILQIMDDTLCVYFFVCGFICVHVLVCVEMPSSSVISQAPTTISVSVIFAVLFLRQGPLLA